MLKRHSKKPSSKRHDSNNYKESTPPLPLKCYSMDDNFHTYGDPNNIYENGNFYNTYGNRNRVRSSEKKKNSKSKIASDKSPCCNGHGSNALPNRDEVTFKKLFTKVFNSNNSSGGGNCTNSNSTTVARDWFGLTARNNVMEFAPKILGKRFCGKKSGGGDNELYRSNSFRFEKFEKKDDMDTLSVGSKSSLYRQISLCDDYSLPVDFVNKRPLSLDSGTFWSSPSPTSDTIEALKFYCNRADQKETARSEETDSESKDFRLYTSPAKAYSDPYTDSTDNEREDDLDQDAAIDDHVFKKRETISKLKPFRNNTYTEVRKSPYYYGDLLKKSENNKNPAAEPSFSKSSFNFDVKKKSSSQIVLPAPPRKSYSNVSTREFGGGTGGGGIILNSNNNFAQEQSSSYFDADDLEMATKQRQMYETAFDSKVGRSTERLDLDIDMVTNHVLERCSPQTPNNNCAPCSIQRGDGNHRNKFLPNHHKTAAGFLNGGNCKYESSVDNLSQNLTDLDLNGDQTLLTQVGGYSSASTATMPRFSGGAGLNNSVDSFSESPVKGRRDNPFIDIRLRLREDISGLDIRNHNIPYRRHSKHKISAAACCGGNVRPKSCHENILLEIKSRPPLTKTKFSSTDSSSGGSLESIKSSTSEGNRSTTSTDSRHSSSLSSHSSDGGNKKNYCPGGGLSLGGGCSNRFYNQKQNKMHILSPISDKSFQELGSDSSELTKINNYNNLSATSADITVKNKESSSPVLVVVEDEKCSSPLVENPNDAYKKRRLPQNKNLTHIGLNMNSSSTRLSMDSEIHLGSDSGISIESRGETKLDQMNDLQDLPFDMPKLRRRRLQQMQSSTQDTSSSATSVDLKDLPFDMPKLRRKLRTSDSGNGGSINTTFDDMQTTNQHNDFEKESSRPPLNLNFESGQKRRSLGLSLNLNDLNNTENLSADIIDVNIPLERQGWYHGAITRMEAEKELKHREEGSYLVRNSESSKQDYSLSLKGSKGFMHMKIEKDANSDAFILGQFSSPFETIPHMIRFYSSNHLPIRGAEHMCLLEPVIVQLL